MTKSVTVTVDASSPNGVQPGLGNPVIAPGSAQTVTVPYRGLGLSPANGGPATWTMANAGTDPLDVATTTHAPLSPSGSVSFAAKETVVVG